MSIRNAVLFLPNGKGAGLMFAQWKARMPLRAIQAHAVLLDGEMPSAYFRDIAAAAFPRKPRLPDRCAHKDGTATTEFWDWLLQ